MLVDDQIVRVLRLYGDDCRPRAIEPLRSSTSFSGARLWRLSTPRGPLCLRAWQGHPEPDRLEFIQAVLWHVDQEGFHLVPLPLETPHRHGYVWHAGHYWELAPWLPGAPLEGPVDERQVASAMKALARFHHAASTFPLADSGPMPSPGICQRLCHLRKLLDGGSAEIRRAIGDGRFPELAERAAGALALFKLAAPQVLTQLTAAASLRVAIQPCIRDVWKAHVLFAEGEVSGIVDFSAMRPENVAADVARLLGSMVGDDPSLRRAALAAYACQRRLSADEQSLIAAFDTSGVLMSPMNWLEWVFIEHRQFAQPAAVVARFDELLVRLAKLAEPAV